MEGGVGLKHQPLIESEEFDIAGFTGSEENEGPPLLSHAGSTPTTMNKGTVHGTTAKCVRSMSANY